MAANKPLVVGSVVYDIIFAVHGNLQNEIHIKDGNLQKISMMLTAKNKARYFGGTAGNIAYGLGMLGMQPLLHSVVGDDFNHDYAEHLVNLGVELRVDVKPENFTATFYSISDEDLQQIGIFQPNVYYDFIEQTPLKKTLSATDLNNVTVAIFSPGNAISTRNHMQELRNERGNKAQLIFDPSQALSAVYTKDTLLECLKLADIFIGNETEIAQLQNLFDLDKAALFKLGIKWIIETKGENGITVYGPKVSRDIKATKPRKLVETTGAGDAFRAGMMYGLLNGKDIFGACEIGTITGARSVEEFGGQLYKIKTTELIY